MLLKWDDLPEKLKNPEVRPYYESLSRKRGRLVIKRLFDFAASLILLILLSWLFLIIAIIVKLDSRGTIIYRQTRVTRYGRKFSIYKFRTMTVSQKEEDAKRQLTLQDDSRITKHGKALRKYRLDELPQLVNILKGEMSFVGTRPEVPKYVKHYTPEMMATLLMPAGVTGIASIEYKEEDEELASAEDPTEHYIKVILPDKMKMNLKELEEFSLMNDLKTMFKTVAAVFK